jgi:cyclomaltodextrinase / maltogenic alpha-amylase / neopullulanase
VLLTLGGTPSIYYGDEQAFRGVKEDRVGGDDAVRPAFPAQPAELAQVGRPVYHLHQELIGLRRRHPWLHTARTKVVTLSNEHLVYEASSDGAAVTVALNLSGTAAQLPVPSSALTVLAGRGTRVPGRNAVSLPGYGWAVLGTTP